MESDQNYQVVSSMTPGQLASLVDVWIQRGWRPAGGVSVGKDGTFHQAMLRAHMQTVGTINLREPKRK